MLRLGKVIWYGDKKAMREGRDGRYGFLHSISSEKEEYKFFFDKIDGGSEALNTGDIVVFKNNSGKASYAARLDYFAERYGMDGIYAVDQNELSAVFSDDLTELLDLIPTNKVIDGKLTGNKIIGEILKNIFMDYEELSGTLSDFSREPKSCKIDLDALEIDRQKFYKVLSSRDEKIIAVIIDMLSYSEGSMAFQLLLPEKCAAFPDDRFLSFYKQFYKKYDKRYIFNVKVLFNYKNQEKTERILNMLPPECFKQTPEFLPFADKNSVVWNDDSMFERILCGRHINYSWLLPKYKERFLTCIPIKYLINSYLISSPFPNRYPKLEWYDLLSEERINKDFGDNPFLRKRMFELKNTVEEKKKIGEITAYRKIKDLVHFTSVNNLVSILENGLKTRKHLEENNIPFEYTDANRYDNVCDSISLSVTFPNSKMFYSKRKQYEAEGRKWCVLLLNAFELLTDLKCAFFPHNAAVAAMSSIPISERCTSKYFNEMFADKVSYVRSDNSTIFYDRDDLPSMRTTDPQAEILCLDNIDVKYICECIFYDSNTENEYAEILDKYKIPHRVQRGYF